MWDTVIKVAKILNSGEERLERMLNPNISEQDYLFYVVKPTKIDFPFSQLIFFFFSQTANSIFSPRDVNIWRGVWKWTVKEEEKFSSPAEENSLWRSAWRRFTTTSAYSLPSHVRKWTSYVFLLTVRAETSSWGVKKGHMAESSKDGKWMSRIAN